MKQMPEFENYMLTKGSKNYGLNSLRFFDADGNVFWFSYKTLVAFKAGAAHVVCRRNEWGPTTGKHLNAIEPDKTKRVDGETFARLYEETFGGANV